MAALVAGVALIGCATTSTSPPPNTTLDKPAHALRIAVFNTALSGKTADDLPARLATTTDAQLRGVAETLQRARPDVVALLEFDHDPAGTLTQRFRDHYLSASQNGAEPIDYPYAFSPFVNTGQPSGVDLDHDGKTTGPGDAFGWGTYPGQYGILILSRFPLDTLHARTFRTLRWIDAPDPNLPSDYYSAQAVDVLRLSSKTHLILPVTLDAGSTLSLLVSHPTPPVFDGPEDRNGRRNHDEIALWTHLINGHPTLTDDAGQPVPPLAGPFVLLGDLNADPFDGDAHGSAIANLLAHPRIAARPTPASAGAVIASARDAGINTTHRGDPAFDTADFPESARGPGNLRVDYALPSTDLRVLNAGVYWPAPDDPHAHLADVSDHKLVWIDVDPR